MFNEDNNEGCNKFWDIWIDTCYLFHGDAYVAFYAGLSSFQLYRDTEDTMWLDRGRQYLAEMKRFRDQGLSLKTVSDQWRIIRISISISISRIQFGNGTPKS